MVVRVAAFLVGWFLVAAVVGSVFGRVVRLREDERPEDCSEGAGALSVRVLAWAMDVNVPAEEKALLLRMADGAADDGMCWPDVDDLAEATRVPADSVRRSLDRLRERGLLGVVAPWDEENWRGVAGCRLLVSEGDGR